MVFLCSIIIHYSLGYRGFAYVLYSVYILTTKYGKSTPVASINVLISPSIDLKRIAASGFMLLAKIVKPEVSLYDPRKNVHVRPVHRPLQNIACALVGIL